MRWWLLLLVVAGCNSVLGIGDNFTTASALTVIVDGAGHVTSSAPTLDCTRQCDVDATGLDQIVLEAEPYGWGGATFTGWDGVICPTARCTVDPSMVDQVTAHFEQPNFAFVDSTSVRGDIGVAGADGKCNDDAVAAGLPGHYVAMLWSSTSRPEARIAPNARGWIRVDGAPVADTLAELTAPTWRYPVMLDQTGADGGADKVWSGVQPDGTVDPTRTCADWTSGSAGNGFFGFTDATSNGSVAWGEQSCGKLSHLYCVEDDKSQALPPPPAPAGRKAFVADGFTPGTGAGAADTICQQAAAGANLTGMFLALIATGGMAPGDRFDPTRPVWVRTDGYPLAATAQDFLDATRWDLPLDTDATGVRRSGCFDTWTGATAPTGGQGPNCGDWNGTTGDGLRGWCSRSAVDSAFGNQMWSCASTFSVYCLEQ